MSSRKDSTDSNNNSTSGKDWILVDANKRKISATGASNGGSRSSASLIIDSESGARGGGGATATAANNNNNNNSGYNSSNSNSDTDSPNEDGERKRSGSASIDPTNKMMEKFSAVAPAEPKLLPGEEILWRVNFIYEQFRSTWQQGTLFLTNYQISFLPTNYSSYEDMPQFEGSQIPLLMIHRVDKIGGKSTKVDHTYLIEIHTKDLRIVRYSFIPAHRTRRKVFDFLRHYTVPTSTQRFFCFSHKIPITDRMIDGWKVYNIEREFVRQGVFATTGGSAEPRWRLSDVNIDFGVCETYPQRLCVPAIVSDEDLRNVSAFRSKGRIPCLTWYNARTGSSLTRSSQPMTGILRKSSESDQKLIESIYLVNPNTSAAAALTSGAASGPAGAIINNHYNYNYSNNNNSNSNNAISSAISCTTGKLLIVDLRPRANAEANRAMGMGYEMASQYKNIELKFLGIDNIHVMRDSYKKLIELCMITGGSDIQWYSKLEATNWLEHLRTVLTTARYVADCLEKEKTSILVHCSDGWDRTAQVASMTQIILDPYYRTLEGFAVLMEKDWLSFGHKFHTRCGHGMRNFFEDQRGPIFLQFADCLYQLMCQYPTAFEYNEYFLIFLLDNIYSCRFGSFVFDSWRERLQARIPERTTSIWTHVLNAPHRDQFRNPFFSPNTNPLIIYPNTNHSSLRLWTGYFLRFCRNEEGSFGPAVPSRTLDATGMAILSELTARNDERRVVDMRNEQTVQTFQRELKAMFERIDALCKENAEQKQRHERELLKWKKRYEKDTTMLLALCEQQRDELALWSSSNHNNNNNNNNNNGSSSNATATAADKHHSVEHDDIDKIIKDFRHSEQQQQQQQQQLKAYDNNATTAATVTNDNDGDDDDDDNDDDDEDIGASMLSEMNEEDLKRFLNSSDGEHDPQQQQQGPSTTTTTTTRTSAATTTTTTTENSAQQKQRRRRNASTISNNRLSIELLRMKDRYEQEIAALREQIKQLQQQQQQQQQQKQKQKHDE